MTRGRATETLLRFAPPIAVDAIREFRRKRAAHVVTDWEYLPGGWPEDPPVSGGWDHPSVAATQEASWARVLARAERPNVVSAVPGWERASQMAMHGTIMTFAYVLGRTAVGQERISVLDWGCGLGQHAVYARGLFPELSIDYHCRELPDLVRAARALLPGDAFYEEDGQALARSYDLVVASGSLQYVRDWAASLERLAAVARRFLYVTRLPVVRSAPSFVVVQRPHAIGYHTDYPGWFLNREAFLAAASHAGLALDREFIVEEPLEVPRAPEQPTVGGFLFSTAQKD